jgi:hypothetical protein
MGSTGLKQLHVSPPLTSPLLYLKSFTCTGLDGKTRGPLLTTELLGEGILLFHYDEVSMFQALTSQ